MCDAGQEYGVPAAVLDISGLGTGECQLRDMGGGMSDECDFDLFQADRD